jgi:UDPglucose 6-dehydrogenase
LRLWDPIAREKFEQAVPGHAYFDDPLTCAEGADALLILTDWPAVRKMDLQRLKQTMKCPIIIDGRNVFEPAAAAAAGFIYHSVGRRAGVPPR